MINCIKANVRILMLNHEIKKCIPYRIYNLYIQVKPVHLFKWRFWECISSPLSEQQTNSLLEYGNYLGLAFQAKDDTLSKTESVETLGKPASEQADENKLTYPLLFGFVQNAQIEADKLN